MLPICVGLYMVSPKSHPKIWHLGKTNCCRPLAIELESQRFRGAKNTG